MALKVRVQKPKLKLSWPHLSWSSWLVRGVIGAVLLVGIVGFSVFTFYYNKYARIVDERLKQPLFANTAKIYAAPREVRPGQKISAHLIATNCARQDTQSTVYRILRKWAYLQRVRSR